MKNKIFSDEEYMAQGFTKEEVEKVRRSDILFNNFDNLTEEEKEEIQTKNLMKNAKKNI